MTTTGDIAWVHTHWTEVVEGDRVSLSPSNTIDVLLIDRSWRGPKWFYRWVGESPIYEADPRQFTPTHLHKLVDSTPKEAP